ncbi:Hpt domain-containing protein, partial [Planococcus sp. SIMBA_160]
DFEKWKLLKTVHEKEIYRFLHTMKGTAGTIGLMDVSNYCSSQLDFYSDNSTDSLPVEPLQVMMAELRGFFAAKENETPAET